MIEQFDGLERQKTFEFLQAGKNRNDLTVQELRDATLNSLRLIAEEFCELLDACGIQIDSDLRDEIGQMVQYGKEDPKIRVERTESDPVEIIDAVCDIKVVLANFEYFLSIEEVCYLNMKLVEANNLTKVNVNSDCADRTIEEYEERGMTNLTKSLNFFLVWLINAIIIN